MRVVGIDPGSLVTGWGVIESGIHGAEQGPYANETRYLESGRIITPRRESIHKRLKHLHLEVTKVLAQWSPNAVSLEKVFIANNPQSALRLGEARGVILLAVAQFGIDLYEYSPAEVKTTITGYGRASKEEVQRMISHLLGYQNFLPEDEADALGAALSCLYRSSFEAALKRSEHKASAIPRRSCAR